MKSERSTRPISLSVLLRALGRGKAAILRRKTEGGTMPARIEAAMRSTSSQFSSIMVMLTGPAIMGASTPWEAPRSMVKRRRSFRSRMRGAKR